MKNNEINNQNQDGAATNDHDSDRRTMLKSSACAIGALYIAPATLTLLTSKRATAQSVVTYTYMFVNNTSANIRVGGGDFPNEYITIGNSHTEMSVSSTLSAGVGSSRRVALNSAPSICLNVPHSGTVAQFTVYPGTTTFVDCTGS